MQTETSKNQKAFYFMINLHININPQYVLSYHLLTHSLHYSISAQFSFASYNQLQFYLFTVACQNLIFHFNHQLKYTHSE